MRPLPISQYASDPIGVETVNNNVRQDADGSVTVTIVRVADNVVVVPPSTATRDGLGLYSFLLLSIHTQIKGEYRATWTYVMGGDNRTFVSTFEITDPMPSWDSFSPELKQLVLDIYFRIQDLYDSSLGGPYLWEPEQSSFGYETIARLMRTEAPNYINLTRQPILNFYVAATTEELALVSGTEFPMQWYGLLAQATYWATLKHLSRSYKEQPDLVGANITTLDRKRYHDLWKQEAQEEKETLDKMLLQVKRKYLLSSGRSMLVSGGAFPRYFGTPARPHWPYAVARY